MKCFKRALSIILALLTILPTLVSCGNTTGNRMITGEFYALFIERAGLYYVSEHSGEEVGYDAEAQAMVDWGLRAEEEAFDNLYDPVTKETVITVCINNMYFTKEGDVNSFKDAKLCNNPQLMANAVATGIVELKNGYLDAKEKMTKEDCLKIIDMSLEIDSESHFEDGTGTVEYNYGDEYAFFTGDDIDPNDIEVYGYSNEQYSLESTASETTSEGLTQVSNTDAAPGVSLLAATSNSIKPTTLTSSATGRVDSNAQITTLENKSNALEATPLADSDSERFTVNIPKRVFEETLKNPKVGDKIIYAPHILAFREYQYKYSYDERVEKSFAGKLLSIQDNYFEYICEFERLDDAEILSGMEVKGYGKTIKTEELSDPIYEANVDGFSIAFEKIDNGYRVTAEKTFEISQNEYNNWRDWKAEPKLTVSATITDFHVDVDGIKNLVSSSKKDKAILSLSYKTTQDANLEAGGLRLAPDSNRNGKFRSNISKSRFTSGAGAKSVKIGGIDIHLEEIGLTIPIRVYLEVSVDGKVHIGIEENKNFSLVRQNGQLKFKINSVKDTTTEVTGNIDAGLRAEVGINIALMRKSVVVFYGKIGVNATVYSKVYEGETLLDTGYADAEDLKHEHEVQIDMHFCLDISGYVYAEIGLCEGTSYGSFVADLLKLAGTDINILKFRVQSDSVSFFHLEDGLDFPLYIVAECSRGDKLEVNSEGEIKLDSYKENMLEKEQISVSVLSIPMKERKFEDNGGFEITVKNEDIARVEYDESLNLLHIYALKEGSTEAEIKVVKTRRKWRKKATYYKQEISITVNAENGAGAYGGGGSEAQGGGSVGGR